MSKRELKKFLLQLSKEQLEEQIITMYDKFTPVKTYYNFVFNPNEANIIKDAKIKIANEFFPIRGKRPKMRRSVSQKLIKHFIVLGVDPFLIADVMLYSIEMAQSLSAEKVVKQDAFFKGILSSLQQSIRFINENKIAFEFKGRVEAIKDSAVKQNWSNQFEFITVNERFED